MEAIDKAFIDLLKRGKYKIKNEDELTIQDEHTGFTLLYGELTCLHTTWHEDTDETHLPPPHTDYETKYALCNDCDEDVSDEVGFNEPKEDL